LAAARAIFRFLRGARLGVRRLDRVYVPPSYTFSGHLPTQVYGFFATFLEAFLWAGLGGAATVYAAAAEREKLTAIFRR